MMNYSVVILAAGSSTRIGTGQKKEFLPLRSKNFPHEKSSTVLSCVGEAFLSAAKQNPKHKLTSIFLVCPPDNKGKDDVLKAFTSPFYIKDLLNELNITLKLVEGGKTRQDSVFNALAAISKEKIKCDFVAIHDGARPWIKPKLINSCLDIAEKFESCAPIIPVVDTIKELDVESKSIKKHLARNTLGAIQTPQIFEFKQIYNAHKMAHNEQKEFTDDTEIWSYFTHKDVFYTEGDIENKKITYANDINLTDKI